MFFFWKLQLVYIIILLILPRCPPFKYSTFFTAKPIYTYLLLWITFQIFMGELIVVVYNGSGFCCCCCFNNEFVSMCSKWILCISLIGKVNQELLKGRKHVFLTFKNMPIPLKNLPTITIQEMPIIYTN